MEFDCCLSGIQVACTCAFASLRRGRGPGGLAALEFGDDSSKHYVAEFIVIVVGLCVMVAASVDTSAVHCEGTAR